MDNTQVQQDLERLYAKIEKLLALQNSPNENEAALAAQRVQSLLLKYNIDLTEVHGFSQRDEIQSDVISVMPGNRKYHWCGTLASAIGEVNCCKVFWTGAALRGVGRPAAITTTKHTFAYLLVAVESIADKEWKAWKKGAKPSGGESTRWYNSFVQGCVYRLCMRLREQLQQQKENGVSEADSNISALVVRSFYEKEWGAIEEWQAANVRLRTGTKSAAQFHPEGFAAGHEAGDRISLVSQVEAEPERKQLSGVEG